MRELGTGLAPTYVRGAWLGFAAGVAAAVTGRHGVLVAGAVALLVAAQLVRMPAVRARAATIDSASDAPPEAMRRSTSHLHDTRLQIVVERGLVGLALWLWLDSLVAVVTSLVSGLFEYDFGDTEVLLVAPAIMALPVAPVRSRPAGAAA